MISDLVATAGVTDAEIFRDKLLELPGYFRPTKEWDLLVVRERHYNAAALIMSRSETGTQGIYTESASDLSFELFARSLVAHVGAYAK